MLCNVNEGRVNEIDVIEHGARVCFDLNPWNWCVIVRSGLEVLS